MRKTPGPGRAARAKTDERPGAGSDAARRRAVPHPSPTGGGGRSRSRPRRCGPPRPWACPAQWHQRSSDVGLQSTLSSTHDAMQPILIATCCKHATLGGASMIDQDTVLVQLICLIKRTPSPPPPRRPLGLARYVKPQALYSWSRARARCCGSTQPSKKHSV